MAKTKKSSDVNLTAFQILEAITGEQPCHASPVPDIKDPTKKKATPKKPSAIKNPAAVALGPLRGLKGGEARMEKLSAKRRAEIARKAAKARWKTN
jgi:hypothetical protein